MLASCSPAPPPAAPAIAIEVAPADARPFWASATPGSHELWTLERWDAGASLSLRFGIGDGCHAYLVIVTFAGRPIEPAGVFVEVVEQLGAVVEGEPRDLPAASCRGTIRVSSRTPQAWSEVAFGFDLEVALRSGGFVRLRGAADVGELTARGGRLRLADLLALRGEGR